VLTPSPSPKLEDSALVVPASAKGSDVEDVEMVVLAYSTPPDVADPEFVVLSVTLLNSKAAPGLSRRISRCSPPLNFLLVLSAPGK